MPHQSVPSALQEDCVCGNRRAEGDEGKDNPDEHGGIVVADLKVRLSEEMKEALKAGEKVRLSALRLLAAAVKNREVELRREVTEEEFLEVVGREVKRRKEAAEAYEKADRQDRVDQEREEQATLEAYLPAGLSDPEVEALIEEAISETGASEPGDFGKVMSHVMGKARGRVDGAKVNALVRSRLGGT